MLIANITIKVTLNVNVAFSMRFLKISLFDVARCFNYFTRDLTTSFEHIFRKYLDT